MVVKEINAKQLSKWFMAGKWSAEMIDDAVKAGKITEAEAEKIKKLPVKA